MMIRTRKAIVGTTLTGLALLATGCVTDAKVEVTNGCGETVVFAHFQEDYWAPEFRDEKFAEVEWVTLKPGDSSGIRISAESQPTAMITVVADGADHVWDPIVVDVELEDPEDWHKGKIELAGDRCG